MPGPKPAPVKKQTRKPNRLLNRGDFLRVAASGKKIVTSGFVMQKAAGNTGAVRYGLTATKKIGNAVKRNRARRRLRALAENILCKKAKGGDYVLIAREATLTRDFALMADELEKALQKLAAA